MTSKNYTVNPDGSITYHGEPSDTVRENAQEKAAEHMGRELDENGNVKAKPRKRSHTKRETAARTGVESVPRETATHVKDEDVKAAEKKTEKAADSDGA